MNYRMKLQELCETANKMLSEYKITVRWQRLPYKGYRILAYNELMDEEWIESPVLSRANLYLWLTGFINGLCFR